MKTTNQLLFKRRLDVYFFKYPVNYSSFISWSKHISKIYQAGLTNLEILSLERNAAETITFDEFPEKGMQSKSLAELAEG